MDTNQNATTTFTNAINSTRNNLEKMERAGGGENNTILHDHHPQIPIGLGIWPNNYHTPFSSSTATPSSNLLNNILGINFKDEDEDEEEDGEEELGAIKEMMYRIAAMQPVDIDPAAIRKPERKNVRISDDPQSVAARRRRERISEKIRILQRLVPGGTKMDTASMLDEAIHYVKFLKKQIRLLQSTSSTSHQHQQPINCNFPVPAASTGELLLATAGYWPFSSNIVLQGSAAITTATASAPGVEFNTIGHGHAGG